MIRRLWPRSPGQWVTVISIVVAFAVLDALVIAGSDFALKLLVSLTGAVAGVAVAYAIMYPFRRRFADSGMSRFLGLLLSFALVLGILYGGAALAGVPAFPTTGSGYAGTFIYGFAFGFGVSAPRSLGLSSTRQERSRNNRTDWRVLALVLGVPAGLLTLLFALYFLGRYVFAPLVRYFAV